MLNRSDCADNNSLLVPVQVDYLDSISVHPRQFRQRFPMPRMRYPPLPNVICVAVGNIQSLRYDCGRNGDKGRLHLFYIEISRKPSGLI